MKSAAGTTYDSGDFPAVLEQALEAADWKGFNKRKRESKKRGKRARHRRRLLSRSHRARRTRKWAASRFDADGGVTIRTGTLDYGQGHATPFAQVLSEKLGVPFDKVRLLQGDSDELLAGGGTGGSRSMMNSGQAIVEASAEGDRAGQADRLARAGSLGRRHRVQGRPLRRRRHRPRHRHHGAGAEGARRA